jgi:hypothetical protein
MATIKIFLEDNETEHDVKEMLRKALDTDPKEHDDNFAQPAAKDVYEKMLSEHENMWERMLREISAVLDEEVAE